MGGQWTVGHFDNITDSKCPCFDSALRPPCLRTPKSTMAPLPRFYAPQMAITTSLPVLSALLTTTDWAASVTKMEELISMLQWVGSQSSRREIRVASTTRALTLILNRFEEHLERLGTMPERMVTSSMNLEMDLQNLELFQADVTAFGQMLSLQRLKRIFCRTYANTLQGISFYIMNNSEISPTVTGRLPLRPINPPTLRRSDSTVWRDGSDSSATLVEEEDVRSFSGDLQEPERQYGLDH